jgi:hypothetical protein
MSETSYSTGRAGSAQSHLERQLSTLQFGYLQIIDRTVRQCLGNLLFECPMLPLKSARCTLVIVSFTSSSQLDFNAFRTLD